MSKPITPLRERLTPGIIEKLVSREMTNAQAAKMLGSSENYLGFVFNQVLDKRREKGKIAQSRENAKKLVEARRDMRIREAKKVINGIKDLAKAAKTAKCSERTMRRYVEKIAPKIKPEAYE